MKSLSRRPTARSILALLPDISCFHGITVTAVHGAAHTSRGTVYAAQRGYYGLPSIFLLLALMALARIGSLEQLRYRTAGELGELLGLDRAPEVRTLRAK